MGMIFYFSHQPGDFVQLPQLMGIDKFLHGIAYAILAGACLYGLHPITLNAGRALTAFIVLMFCLLFAISDEYHQAFIPGRFASVWDVAADAGGALLVVGVWYWKWQERT